MRWRARRPHAGRVATRWRRGDVYAVVAIALTCVLALGGAFYFAPARHAHLSVAAAAPPVPQPLEIPPTQLSVAWQAPDMALPGALPAVAAQGVVVTSPDGQSLRAFDSRGQVAWEYRRQAPLCALSTAWKKIIAVYRTGVGCGDVLAFDAATGQYAGTRSALNSPDVVVVRSNDRIGTFSPERLELWRNDLVRTVEYGQVPAVQEPALQPHPECTLSSALTRLEKLALTQDCPGDPNSTLVAVLDTTPEDAREPKINHEWHVPVGARVVAIAREAVALYLPSQGRIASYDTSGRELASHDYRGPALEGQPTVADLPHHMTWLNGADLVMFEPTNLAVQHVLQGVVGNPVAVGGAMLVPTAAGIEVVDWGSGEVLSQLPVDRQGYAGRVGLTVVGDLLVEKRGGMSVSYQMV